MLYARTRIGLSVTGEDIMSSEPSTPIAGLATPRAARSPTPLWSRLALAVVAGLCWSGALVLLLWFNLGSTHALLSPPRLIYYVLVLTAGVLTFLPMEYRMQIPGLTFEGVGGTALLFYTLAFVPAPTGSLLSLPDVPVYLVFAAAVFWTVSAMVLPVLYGLGQRVFRQRARQYDLRRARRQAHGIGALIALCLLLAGLRVLTPLSVLLLTGILITAEMLFLTFVRTES